MPEHRSHSGVPIPESESELLGQCRVDVFRSGGKGGQHQNVTESGVRLTHLSTGTVVISRRFRSQLANKRKALVTLRKTLAALRKRKKKAHSNPPLPPRSGAASFAETTPFLQEDSTSKTEGGR